MLRLEEAEALMWRVRIIGQHQGRARLHDAIHEQLDPVRPEHVRVPAPAHLLGLLQPVEGVFRFQMKRGSSGFR